VLRAAAPSASVDQVIAAMKQGGKQVQDWCVGFSFGFWFGGGRKKRGWA
jgi:hypothetical protein